MASYLQSIVGLTVALTKRYLRNKVALFFTVIFPLIFLFIFGGIFGGDSAPDFDIALLNSSDTEFAIELEKQFKDTDLFVVNDTKDFDDAKEMLGRGELDGIVQFPEAFGQPNEQGLPTGEVELIYDEGDDQLSATLQAVLQGTIDGINSEFVMTSPPFSLSSNPIQTANLTAFDYTFSGLLGFAILGLGIFSMANGFSADKKTGALRRLRVAPLSKWQFIVATAFNRIIIGILTIAIMFAVALLFFDFTMRGSYIAVSIFTVLATILMFGFGMAIAGWAKRRHAGGTAQ